MKEDVTKKSEKKEESTENKKETLIDQDKDKSKKTDIDPRSDKDKIKDLEEKVVRSLAEMENQRRRFEKEKEDAFEFGGFVLAKESLGLIDNLDRAKTSILNDETFKKNKDLKKILENFEIVQKDLISIFKKNGIEQINCLNKKFDPNFHQAMLEIESETKEPGTVIQEIQKGFTMKGRLLRPSLVGITKTKTDQKDMDEVNQQTEENEKYKENKEKNDNKS